MSKEDEYKIHDSLYISKLNRPPENIEIEEYSMVLLSQGVIGQRYAVVGFINESNGQILLFFRPSFQEGVEDKNRDLFLKKDRVESRKDVTGIVHLALIALILQQYKDKGAEYAFLYYSKKIGLSFYKYSLYALLWINRSTLNSDVFEVNEVATYALYFKKQDSFMRPEYTNFLYLQRSLEITLFDNIKVCVKLKILAYYHVSMLSADEIKSEEEAQLLSREKCTNYADAKQWKNIYKDKFKIGTLFMDTIYFASGMRKATKKNPWPQDENFFVIKNTLETAKKYNLKIIITHIPEVFFEDKLYMIIHAINALDFKTVEVLINANTLQINLIKLVEKQKPYLFDAFISLVKEGRLPQLKLLQAILPDMLKEFLQKKDSKNYTALMTAKLLNKKPVIQWLLEQGAVHVIEPDFVNSIYNKIKLLLVQKKFLETMMLLRLYSPNIDKVIAEQKENIFFNSYKDCVKQPDTTQIKLFKQYFPDKFNDFSRSVIQVGELSDSSVNPSIL